MRGLSTVSSGHFSEGHFRVTYELCTGGSLGRGMRPPGPPWPCSGPVLCRTGVALCCTGVAQELPLTPHQDKKNGPKPQRKPPKPSGTEQKIYFLLRVGGEPSYATPPNPVQISTSKDKVKRPHCRTSTKTVFGPFRAGQLEKGRFRTRLWFPIS